MTVVSCTDEPTKPDGKNSVPAIATAVRGISMDEAGKAITDKKFGKVVMDNESEGAAYVYPAELAALTEAEQKQAILDEKEFVSVYIAPDKENKVDEFEGQQKFETAEKAFGAFKTWAAYANKEIASPKFWMAYIEQGEDYNYYFGGEVGTKFLDNLKKTLQPQIEAALAQLDEYVKAGYLTQEQADQYKAEYEKQLSMYGDRAAYDARLAKLSAADKFVIQEINVLVTDEEAKTGYADIVAYSSTVEKDDENPFAENPYAAVQNLIPGYYVEVGDMSDWIEDFEEEPTAVAAKVRKLIKK